MAQAMKHGSVGKIEEAIRYFNSILKEHSEMNVEFRKGIYQPNNEDGIRIDFETLAHANQSQIFLRLSSHSLYHFDRGGLPTQRMAPSVMDIRDYFARSLLKRPNYTVLNLDVSTSSSEIFGARFEIVEKGQDLDVTFPNNSNPIVEKYKSLIEQIQRSRSGDFGKAVDLAFMIHDGCGNDQ